MSAFKDVLPTKTHTETALRVLPPRYNEPGQPVIDYRIGTYATFVSQMIARLHRESILDDSETPVTPLSKLNTQTNNLAVALIRAWAVVGDVLSFYQERIANEGYLRTAAERRSIVELARHVGYELDPGLSASTYLAFTLLDVPQAPDQVLIPKGTAVQSLPLQGKLSATFETTQGFNADVHWNAMKLDIPTQAIYQQVGAGTTSLQLAGIKTRLRAGDGLFITGQAGDGNVSFFRFVRTVTLDPKKAYSTITWDEPLIGEPDVVLSQLKVFRFKQQARLFGYKTPAWATVPDKTKQQYALRQGGLLTVSEQQKVCEIYSGNLPAETVQALAVDRLGYLLAGSSNGILRSLDGREWQALPGRIQRCDVQTIYVSTDGHLIAGGAGGAVFRSTDSGASWVALRGTLQFNRAIPFTKPINARIPDTVIRAFVECETELRHQRYLLIGSDVGVLRSKDNGISWLPCNKGLSGAIPRSVFALVVDSHTQHVFAGTNHGVFRSRNGGNSWHSIGPSELTHPTIIKRIVSEFSHQQRTETPHYPSVHALLITSGMHGAKLWAGTDQGLFFSINAGHSWHPTSLTGLAVQALATGPAKVHTLYAGTERGLYYTVDDGHTWEHIDQQRILLGNVPLRSLSELAQGYFPEEIRLILRNQGLSFPATAVPTATGTGWTVSDPGQALICHIEKEISSLAIYRHVPLSPVAISAVTVTPAGNVVASTPFGGFFDTDWPDFRLQDNQIDLAKQYKGLAVGDEVVLQQNAPMPFAGSYTIQEVTTIQREGFAQTATISRIAVVDANNLNLFDLRETTVFATPEQLPEYVEQQAILKVVEGDRFALEGAMWGLQSGQLLSVSGEPPTLKNDVSEATSYGEIVEILSVTITERCTEIILVNKLQNSYKADTVHVCGNVVPATHGETVAQEVLGSGDASQPGQQFVLKRPPLTYVPSPDADGSQPQLTVWVKSSTRERGRKPGELVRPRPRSTATIVYDSAESGVQWTQVDSLTHAIAQDQVYTVHIKDDGRTILTFGDGVHGARLPTGNENVIATYRSGLGTDGNSAVGTLTLLKRRPAGLHTVTNPIRATGGMDPETAEEGRLRALSPLTTLGRIISLTDYQTFAAGFAGIAKAKVDILPTGSGSLVHLTVAASDGSAVPESPIYANLADAIRNRQAITQAVKVSPFVPSYFNVYARLYLAPNVDKQEVVDNCKQALLEDYQFNMRSFSQDVSVSDLISTLQDTDGIVAVQIDYLYVNGLNESLNELLSPQTAQWDAQSGTYQPAQLLLINPDCINLTTERT